MANNKKERSTSTKTGGSSGKKRRTKTGRVPGKKHLTGAVLVLVEDVTKLGWLGDIVEVNTGYARNYLLPQGLAIVSTETNIKSLEEEKARRAKSRARQEERLEATAKAVEGAEAVIAAKANEQGVLFGSVGAWQIATNLREQGFEVADDFVTLAHPIKEVGTHSVKLEFTKDLAATVSVVVVPEGADIEALKQAERQAEQEVEKNQEKSKQVEKKEQE